MRSAKGRYLKTVLTLILSVQAVCLCWLCASCASAQAQDSAEIMAQAPASARAAALSADRLSDSSVEPSAGLAGAITQGEWLRDMMLALGLIDEDIEAAQYHAIFSAAYDLGLIDSDVIRPYKAVTRAYAASTIVRALGYEPRSVQFIADAREGDDLMTLVSYGYFVPDSSDSVYPDANLTREEYAMLIGELKNYRRLSGRHLLAFGDSIMFGTGNDEEGIADLIAEKYNMTVTDCSVAGATFGVCSGRSNIADQIKKAFADGESADIILLNGATNDVAHTALGKVSEGFAPDAKNRKSFSGGMDYALALIRQNWPVTPVCYIRAHDMDIRDDDTERLYGERALSIAAKWSISFVDIYSNTGFNAEDREIRDKYTFYKEQIGRTDSVHPTALGYAVFYLPPISEAVCDLI